MSSQNKKNTSDEFELFSLKTIGYISLTAITAGVIIFPLTRYHTSHSNEWLVRTGLMVKDVEIGKKFMRWPFQNIDLIDMTPRTCKFTINAMSKEKMEFNFPAAFTISPKNSEDALKIYSRYLVIQHPDQIIDTTISIIEGETRALAANLTIEEIFSGRDEFKASISSNVQQQLDKLGIEIINANLEKLEDGSKSNYFENLARRINSEAENKAKVDVAEQDKIGNIGSKTREAETRQQTATIEAETTLIENQRNQEIIKSSAELEKIKAEQNLIVEKARIESLNKAEEFRMMSETDVEKKRAHMELEKQRANDLSSILVQAEMAEKKAQGEANAQKILADALFYSKLKESEGVEAEFKAKANGIKALIDAFGNDPEQLIKYKMVDEKTIVEMTDSVGKGIKGMEPKINVWTHEPNQAFDSIKSLSKAIIPMAYMIGDQSELKISDWIKKSNNDTKV